MAQLSSGLREVKDLQPSFTCVSGDVDLKKSPLFVADLMTCVTPVRVLARTWPGVTWGQFTHAVPDTWDRFPVAQPESQNKSILTPKPGGKQINSARHLCRASAALSPAVLTWPWGRITCVCQTKYFQNNCDFPEETVLVIASKHIWWPTNQRVRPK